MTTSLKPQEYYFLYSPRKAVPEEMLKYTIESLVLEGHLQYFYKAIYVNPNHDRKRLRLYISLGKNYDVQQTYSKAETLVLSIFKKDEALRPIEIKTKILDKLDGDIFNYRDKTVYEDIEKRGFIWLFSYLNGNGRKARREYAHLIDTLEQKTQQLINKPDELNNFLKKLGTGIILLDDVTIKKLQLKVPDLKEIAAVFEIITSSGGTYSSGGFYGGGYSGGGFSGGGGGSWGGFGGGMGGGGGSGGSW